MNKDANVQNTELDSVEKNLTDLFRILHSVSGQDEKPLSLPQLCKYLGVGRSTLQRQLTRLVELEVVELKTDERTSIRVKLTELGQAIAASFESRSVITNVGNS